jgi:ATP-dependent Clp protease ATP-binding subunit ClpA|tara:strand:+ start:1599 stop:2984 length:1386 start_codon:yes stop_codon:yes gene_type:complete
MSDFSKYNLTPSAKHVLEMAQDLAKGYKHLKVIDLHLVHCIFNVNHNNIDFAMAKAGWIKEGFIQSLDMVLEAYKEPKRKKQIYAPEIFDILDGARNLAKKNKDEYVGLDHILISLLQLRKEIRDFFVGLNVDVDGFCLLLASIIRNGINYNHKDIPKPEPAIVNGPPPSKKNKIEDWCENLTKKIKNRGTYEIFGRKNEINRSFEILLRKNKSNIILVGEAGVGKTAIVEGLAEQIIQNHCPNFLKNKEILSLDMTSVLAGTMYRGQMEEKVKSIIDEISNSDKYILFIDEIHTIVGAGSSEGSLDLANSLKPVLSRGGFACIGATTKEEYEKYFKGDSALNRRFEKIDIHEPTKEQTLDLMKKAKNSYEKFHNVRFRAKVLEKMINLCEEYLPKKKFPDKAFDILDEAGAKTRIENNEVDGTFDVKMEIIYEIFSQKLNIDKEDIKQNKNIPTIGKIGF